MLRAMTWLASKRSILGLGLICCGGLLTAAGCGSSDGKKSLRSPEADAAGEEASAGQAGAATGGAPGAPEGGAAGDATGGVAAEAGASSGGVPSAGAGGQSGGEGGAPAATCVAEGSVTGLAVESEPIYQGCRGALIKVGFLAQLTPDTFTCCGASTSTPAFSLELSGTSDHDGGGYLVFQVPEDAPLGSYALSLVCQAQPDDQGIAVEINDLVAPKVSSITAQIAPTDVVHVAGEGLDGVSYVGAVDAGGTSVGECVPQQAPTATSLDCTFPNGLPAATYSLELYTESCGYAVSPTFSVVDPG